MRKVLQCFFKNNKNQSLNLRVRVLFSRFLALVFITTFIMQNSFFGLNKLIDKNNVYKNFFQKAYDEGSFYSVECGQWGERTNYLSRKYDSHETKGLIEKSGFLTGEYKIIGSYQTLNSTSYRYEPKNAKRPSFVLSNDSAYSNGYSEKCLVEIIE